MNAIQRKAKRPAQGYMGSLNAIVYALVVFAIVLSGIAAWQRRDKRLASSEMSSQTLEILDRQVDTVLPVLGVEENVLPVGGFGANVATPPRFVCPGCQSTCRPASGVCPACPFCGQGMVARAARPSLAGGLGGTGLYAPIPILSEAAAPHGDRGVCSNCHTLKAEGRFPIGLTPAAAPATQWNGRAAPPIAANARPPELIKEFGIEVSAQGRGGVKVTGVMGNSYASRAGLRAEDVIIEMNGSRVLGVAQFKRLMSQAAPEADAQVKILRNGRTRDLAVMVGEGEMEGFTPIQAP